MKMARSLWALALIGLSTQVAKADAPVVTPVVTRTVMGENLPLTSKTYGVNFVRESAMSVSPDGMHFAYFPNVEPPVPVSVVIDGVSGEPLVNPTEFKWSADSSKLFYLATKDKTRMVVENNVVPTDPSFRADDISALTLVENGGVAQPYFGAKRNEEWTIWKALTPLKLTAVRALYPNLSGSSVMEEGEAAGSDAMLLWRDGAPLGPMPTGKDGLIPNLRPQWSPNGKHVAYSVSHDGKNYLCIDKDGLTDVTEHFHFAWNSNSDQLLVWSDDMSCGLVDFGPDDKPKIAKTFGTASRGDAVWSGDGQHTAFFAPQTGQIIEDGVAKIEGVHFSDDFGEKDFAHMGHIGFYDFYDALHMSRVALSNDGSRLCATDLKPNLEIKKLETFVHTDGKNGSKDGPSFSAIEELRWTPDGTQPIYVARDVPTDKADEYAVWKLVRGNDDPITICVSATEDALTRPLTPLLFPKPNGARIVMMENDKIVRYDFQFPQQLGP